jgi:ABC-type sugar transport system ATPase subunit
MNLLKVEKVSRQEREALVLQDISFTVKEGSRTAIAGATGSGKTTLFKIIAGLLTPKEGQVLFKDRRVLSPAERLIAGEPGIAFLSQEFELRHHYHVEEILEMACKISEQEAEQVYTICRINHLLKRWSDQLSGGERQRIALARLLVMAPELLLLDEPYSNLDTIHKTLMKEVINDISQHLKITCLQVSHDPVDVLSWADQVIVLQNGVLVQQAAPEEIYRRPVNEYVAGLFGKYNKLDEQLAASLNVQQNVFIRPEQFKIHEHSTGIHATITNCRFMGSIYEIEVEVKDKKLLISHADFIPIGDSVYVSLNAR